MITYWPWLLIVLACPLMMLIMMRGMSRNDPGSAPPNPRAAIPPADEQQAQIARLEREVAELREVPGRDPGNAAATRR